MKVITSDGYVQSEVVADDSLQCSSGANVIQCEDYVVINFSLQHGYLDLAELFVPEGRSALNYATANSVPEVIEKVLDSGISGQDAQFTACAVGNSAQDGSSTLMQRAARLWTPSTGYQNYWLNSWCDAIQEACERGNLLVLQWLIQHPLGREAGGNDCDPFHLAAGAGQVELLEYLCTARVSVMEKVAP
ncbi:hypothetical protein PC129_g5423 [Phytophthora cactorum]|uniref:Ankyrin repeat-containing domain n=1 Tax=Phytophthora cactorum TaxID=29920 RepID=A0A329SQU7_9STRA|nr:hypothetical protein Pcac1_g14869 [Phytophthora cactorum]KAG2832974.1 hypothetical protein PC112_g6681 [Phytophthora cactorum]KAG2835381.1 hypothetical protein PC111_g5452 [Phytophthora cactorum]KAG2860890.1 hypothetical protein PC113_g7666 [Phytophthora cactorum]KAG2915490.1 hypothetical protein PC115_g11370 [Phytophthora cactorum]